MRWSNKIDLLAGILKKLEITDRNGEEIEEKRAFFMTKNLLLTIRKNSRVVYAVGNGASASMASHFAADLAKNAQLHTQLFSDLSLITAISNDMGYEKVFSEPLKKRAVEGDLLVAISSSGNSPNIIEAIKTAVELKMTVITLSSMNINNSIRKLGDFNLYIPAKTYGDTESCHAVILHYFIDLIVENPD